MSTVTSIVATNRSATTSLLEKLAQTNDPVAVLNSERRHPRSYPTQHRGEVWRQVKLGDRRKQKLKRGIFDQESLPSLYSPQSQPTVSTPQRSKRHLKKKLQFTPTRSAQSTKEAVAAVRSTRETKDCFNRNPKARLHYGSTIALESIVNNELIAVGNGSGLDGYMHARPPESCNQENTNAVFFFKLVELEDPCSVQAIHYGDNIWLQIYSGNGDPSWRNGSVIGARVREAAALPTVPLRPKEVESSTNNTNALNDTNLNTNSTLSTQRLGVPAPIRATLPKAQPGKDDITWSFHEMRLRNANACVIARWRILPATEDVANRAKERGNFVCNTDPIYLEQDFLYICQDANQSNHPLSLNRIPDTIHNSSGYRVDRRGVWNIRLVADSANLGELSKTEQRTELLMDKARSSLHASKAFRQGRRKYNLSSSIKSQSETCDRIPGGDAFSVYLRESTKAHLANSEIEFMKNRDRSHCGRSLSCTSNSSFIDEKHTFASNQDSVFSAVTAPPAYGSFNQLNFSPSSKQARHFDDSKWKNKKVRMTKSPSVCLDSDELTAASFSTIKQSQDEETTETKSVVPSRQLLGSSASAWAYIMRQEDQIAATQLETGRPPPVEVSSEIPTEHRTEHEEQATSDEYPIYPSQAVASKAPPLDEDEAQSIATRNAIDVWYKKWMRKAAAKDKSIYGHLEQADDLLLRNIHFIKRRNRFDAIFKQLDLSDDITLRISRDTRSSYGDTHDDVKEQSETIEPINKPLDIFSLSTSVKCFQGNRKLLQDMCNSSSRLLKSIILPKLRETLGKFDDVHPTLNMIWEAIQVVLTFTECIIAPRLRASALDLKRILQQKVSPEAELSDIQISTSIAACNEDLDLAELVAAAQHLFIADIEAFVTHIEALESDNAILTTGAGDL